jgi:hypothetical protein
MGGLSSIGLKGVVNPRVLTPEAPAAIMPAQETPP